MIHKRSEKLLALLQEVKGFMTVKDVADEYGLNEGRVRQFCKEHGIKLASPKEVNILYIRQMATSKTKAQIAAKLSVNESYVEALASANGIELTHREEIEDYIPEEIVANLVTPEKPEEGGKEKECIRSNDGYTQSHSPFRIADTLRRIKIL